MLSSVLCNITRDIGKIREFLLSWFSDFLPCLLLSSFEPWRPARGNLMLLLECDIARKREREKAQDGIWNGSSNNNERDLSEDAKNLICSGCIMWKYSTSSRFTDIFGLMFNLFSLSLVCCCAAGANRARKRTFQHMQSKTIHSTLKLFMLFWCSRVCHTQKRALARLLAILLCCVRQLLTRSKFSLRERERREKKAFRTRKNIRQTSQRGAKTS